MLNVPMKLKAMKLPPIRRPASLAAATARLHSIHSGSGGASAVSRRLRTRPGVRLRARAFRWFSAGSSLPAGRSTWRRRAASVHRSRRAGPGGHHLLRGESINRVTGGGRRTHRVPESPGQRAQDQRGRAGVEEAPRLYGRESEDCTGSEPRAGAAAALDFEESLLDHYEGVGPLLGNVVEGLPGRMTTVRTRWPGRVLRPTNETGSPSYVTASPGERNGRRAGYRRRSPVR